MRSLLKILLIGAVGAGCTSGLWGPFAEDTGWNCNVTPCTDGKTCNVSTGACEGGNSDGGSTGDAGTGDGDMMTPVLFTSEETIWKSTTNSYFHLAVGDLAGDEKPEIFLSGDYVSNAQDAVILSGGTSAVNAQPFTMIPGNMLITSLAPYRYGATPQDVVAVSMSNSNKGDSSGQLHYIYKNGTTTAIQNTNTNLKGFKAMAVGFAPGDAYPDIAVTSSLSPISGFIYPFNGADGAAIVFKGQAPAMRGNFGNAISVQGSGYSIVTLVPSAFNLSSGSEKPAFCGATTKPGSSNIGLISDENGTVFKNQSDQQQNDVVLIADMDRNGTNDLVMLHIFPTQSTLRISFNKGTNAAPSYGDQILAISDPDNNITSMTDITLMDLDADGYTDIGVGMYTKKSFMLLRNRADKNGARTFTPVRTISSTYGARGLAYDDMNSDGCKDLIALFGGETGSAGSEVKLLLSTCPK